MTHTGKKKSIVKKCVWLGIIQVLFFRQETVAELLNHMFNGEKNESVIVNGLSVIQTLLEFRKVG